jgi:hypothetical protein
MNRNNACPPASTPAEPISAEGRAVQEDILLSWIGRSDLKASSGEDAGGPGPVARAIASHPYDRVVLLSNFPEADTESYLAWITKQTRASVEARPVTLANPASYEEVWAIASASVAESLAKPKRNCRLTFLLSAGTPTMAAVWIILAKTRFEAALVECSRERGVRPVNISLPS